MRYRPLGSTGLTVSEVGFGCASYWGKPAFAEARAISLVDAAIELGVTFFDTGASYSGGAAEARLGRALKGKDVSRLVIGTKVSAYGQTPGAGPRDFSAQAVRRSAEGSLRALGLDVLPLLQLHGPAISELTDELLAGLAELKAHGLVKALGVNSFDPQVIEHVIALAALDVVMIDYNVLRPERAPLIAKAAQAGKGVLAGMPLAMGHTGLKIARLKGPQDLWYAARGLLRHRAEVRRGARFRFLHKLPDMTGSQAALAYVLGDPNLACAVVGTTRLAHLREDVAASGLALPPKVLAQIQAVQRRSA